MCDSPGTGVAGSWEPPYVGTRNSAPLLEHNPWSTEKLFFKLILRREENMIST